MNFYSRQHAAVLTEFCMATAGPLVNPLWQCTAVPWYTEDVHSLELMHIATLLHAVQEDFEHPWGLGIAVPVWWWRTCS